MESLSKNTEQIIIGGLLGDSYLRKQKDTHNPHLVMVHGPKQLDYLEFKYSFFVNDKLVTDNGIKQGVANLKKTGKSYINYKFYTQALPLFNNYYNLFYPNGKKIVTRHLLNMLDPLGLAIWFMDDGSRNIRWYKRKDGLKSVKARGTRISTNGFTREEHEIIQKYFDIVWDIKVGIHKSGKSKAENNQQFVTGLNAENSKKLIEIIKPYVIPSLEYKIDLMYNVTSPIPQ